MFYGGMLAKVCSNDVFVCMRVFRRNCIVIHCKNRIVVLK